MTQAKIVTATTSVLLAVTLLTSCSSSPAVTNSSSPQQKWTEEKALAETSAAYADFNNTLNSFFDAPKEYGDHLMELVSSDVYSDQLEVLDQLKAEDKHFQGEADFFNFQVKEISQTEITAVFCGDLTNYKVIDQSNQDVTPKDVPDLIPYRTIWEIEGDRIILKGIDQWSDETLCY